MSDITVDGIQVASHFLGYIYNNSTDGLTPEEIDQFKECLRRHCESMGEGYEFLHFGEFHHEGFARCEVTGLKADVYTVDTIFKNLNPDAAESLDRDFIPNDDDRSPEI